MDGNEGESASGIKGEGDGERKSTEGRKFFSASNLPFSPRDRGDFSFENSISREISLLSLCLMEHEMETRVTYETTFTRLSLEFYLIDNPKEKFDMLELRRMKFS